MHQNTSFYSSLHNKLLTLLTVISLLALLPVSVACAKPAVLDDQAFADFKQSFLDEYWSYSPDWAMYAGYYKYHNKLIVPDNKSRQETAKFANRILAKLEGFDEANLSASNGTDLVLIRNQLESTLWYQNEFKSHQWDPSQYNVANVIGLIINTDYKPMDERLQAIGKRLKKIPAYYAAAKKNIDNPTAVHTRLAIEQSQGALRLFTDTLPDKIAESGLSEENRGQIKNELTSAVSAIKSYIEWLQEVEANFATTPARSFRIGEKLYQSKFMYDIFSDYTAKQLYEKALEQKQLLHKRMYDISVKLWPKYFADKEMPEDRLQVIKQMIDHLAGKHTTREQFLEEVRRQIPLIQNFIDDKQLLDSDPEKPLVVREMPEYQRGSSIATIYSPGPYDTTANTYYNVSPLTGYSPAQAQSYLREYNHWILQILNIHEAIPGHYTQLVHANKSPSKIKSIFGNGAMIEGWAVYSELMMLEEGYGDNEPELWLMYSKWNLRTVVNTILDYSVQVLNMSREDALDLLMNQAFQESTEALGKWRRASLSQVQLDSYFSGYSEILAFREELKVKMGDKFDLKTFHNKFLSYGSSPVPVIRRLILKEWGLAD